MSETLEGRGVPVDPWASVRRGAEADRGAAVGQRGEADRDVAVDGEMTVATAFAGMKDVGIETVMPVVFTAGCPECREKFELGAEAFMLAIGGSSRTTFYSFTCPQCGEAVRKPAGERIVGLLMGAGVRTLRLQGS